MQSNKYLKKAVNICRLKIYHSKNVKPSHFSNTSVFQTYTSSESDTSENHCYIHRPGALKRKLDTSADESNVSEVNARMFHDVMKHLPNVSRMLKMLAIAVNLTRSKELTVAMKK